MTCGFLIYSLLFLVLFQAIKTSNIIHKNQTKLFVITHNSKNLRFGILVYKNID